MSSHSESIALPVFVLTGVCVLLAPAACASSAGDDPADDGGGAPAVFNDGAPARDAGSLSGDAAAPSCTNALDEHGCACKVGTPPRSCYTGPKAQAGVGKCILGTQQCVPANQGEVTTGAWGACTGEGQPTTCSGARAQCGTVADGCGGVLDCGTCSEGLTCGGGGANTCGSGPCMATTCAQQGIGCGPAPDGCMGTLDCGACAVPQTCGGGGQPGQCGCTPTTCGAQGATCGTLSDGCGGTLDCGTCITPETCGGGGVPNACGQPPVIDAGGVVDAGGPEVCTPMTCGGLGQTCGTASDGCGGTLTCGGACTCGPVQNGIGENLFNNGCGLGSRGQIVGSAQDCVNYCNSFSDTLCCYLVGSNCIADNVSSDCQPPCWGSFGGLEGVVCH